MGGIEYMPVSLQMQKYFLGLKTTVPSLSPIDNTWSAQPYSFLEGAHTELRRIFHLWRVSLLLSLAVLSRVITDLTG